MAASPTSSGYGPAAMSIPLLDGKKFSQWEFKLTAVARQYNFHEPLLAPEEYRQAVARARSQQDSLGRTRQASAQEPNPETVSRLLQEESKNTSLANCIVMRLHDDITTVVRQSIPPDVWCDGMVVFKFLKDMYGPSVASEKSRTNVETMFLKLLATQPAHQSMAVFARTFHRGFLEITVQPKLVRNEPQQQIMESIATMRLLDVVRSTASARYASVLEEFVKPIVTDGSSGRIKPVLDAIEQVDIVRGGSVQKSSDDSIKLPQRSGKHNQHHKTKHDTSSSGGVRTGGGKPQTKQPAHRPRINHVEASGASEHTDSARGRVRC